MSKPVPTIPTEIHSLVIRSIPVTDEPTLASVGLASKHFAREAQACLFDTVAVGSMVQGTPFDPRVSMLPTSHRHSRSPSSRRQSTLIQSYLSAIRHLLPSPDSERYLGALVHSLHLGMPINIQNLPRHDQPEVCLSVAEVLQGRQYASRLLGILPNLLQLDLFPCSPFLHTLDSSLALSSGFAQAATSLTKLGWTRWVVGQASLEEFLVFFANAPNVVDVTFTDCTGAPIMHPTLVSGATPTRRHHPPLAARDYTLTLAGCRAECELADFVVGALGKPNRLYYQPAPARGDPRAKDWAASLAPLGSLVLQEMEVQLILDNVG
ncbi:hypothetical protein HDZ31DRAFT_68759 [Schizophyllum fasciatum]